MIIQNVRIFRVNSFIKATNIKKIKGPYPLNSRMFCSVMIKLAFFLDIYVFGPCFRTPATLFYHHHNNIDVEYFFIILTFIPVAVWLIFWKPAAFLR